MSRSMLALALLVSITTAQLPPSVQSVIDEAEKHVTAELIGSHLGFLADDRLEGRGVGTRGDLLSRLYIKSVFEGLGLKAAGPNGSWEQEVPIIGINAQVTRKLTAKAQDGRSLSFTAPRDYTTFAGRPDKVTEWKNAELVFIGYGIDAPEQNWDDYKGVDLTGKVALVMNNDPSDDPNLFAGKTRLYYGRWSYKYEEAARRGAVGVIVIHTTPSAGYPFQVIQTGQGQERFWLPFTNGEKTLAIRSWCSEDAAKSLVALGGHDLDELRGKAETRAFRPVQIGVTVDVETTNTIRKIRSANVLAKIPGTDPKLGGQAVVVTAHFDHLGKGRPVRDDDIYNGALDNASGTAALLALARACTSLPSPPRRSIVFAAVTAEESGLLGSLYYARNPTIPPKKIIANYNIDGINIWGPTKDIAMIGYGKNSLTGLADTVAKRRGRVLRANPETDKGLFYRSDHFSFARIGVPSAFFKAGNDFLERGEVRRRVKLSYTGTRYHQPSDEYDARWNLQGAAQDTRLLLECLLRTVEADDPPRWSPGDEFEKLR